MDVIEQKSIYKSQNALFCWGMDKITSGQPGFTSLSQNVRLKLLNDNFCLLKQTLVKIKVLKALEVRKTLNTQLHSVQQKQV